MTESKAAWTRAEFERILETFGADTARWPVGARTAFDRAAETDEGLARSLAAEAAFDRLLARAPAADPRRVTALADRIVAASRRPDARMNQPPPARTIRPSLAAWPPAALLAASLALGVFFGVSGFASQLFERQSNGGGDGLDSFASVFDDSGPDEDLL